VAYSVFNGISPMPSSRKALAAVLQLIKETGSSNSIIDLGSGWGTLCFAVAHAFPDMMVLGYENSPIPFMYCTLLNRLMQYKNLRFFCRNFHSEPLHQAGLVHCYLYSEGMVKLRLKFERELHAGTVVISNTFAVPLWKPQRVIDLKDIYRTRIYLYVTGNTE
jgi:Putative methyltransferase